MEFKEFSAQLQEQLKPIIEDLRELKETMGSTMHPETGIYPKIKSADDKATAANRRIDQLKEELKETAVTRPMIIDMRREINELKEADVARKKARVKILWLIITPTLVGLGAGIWHLIEGAF